MIVLAVDTIGIQRYIFGSNRLQEQIGASYLVAQATGPWAFAALPKPNNIENVNTGTIQDENNVLILSDEKMRSELLYAGGGNVVAIVRSPDEATAFTQSLSRRLLEAAPGLTIVVGRATIKSSLSLAVKEALDDCSRQKRQFTPSAPLRGLGVTVACQSTGLPAIHVVPARADDSARPVSAEAWAKLEAVEAANLRLSQDLSPPVGFAYPQDFDNLGRARGEASYIAVVHADGNGLGQRFLQLGRDHSESTQNAAYARAIRRASRYVSTTATASLREILRQLETGRQRAGTPDQIAASAAGAAVGPIDLEVRDDGLVYLPFRPIVFGGDDVTFVCDGRIGLSLASAFLRAFAIPPAGVTAPLPMSACAGVAIVKSHYPFAQAYALSEQLCGSAKDYRRSLKDMLQGHDFEPGAALDWHLASTGLSGDLGEMRRREYTTSHGSLTLRPVLLTAVPGLPATTHTWTVVQRGTNAFQAINTPPAVGTGSTRAALAQNKVKALRDALRGGPTTVEMLLRGPFGDAAINAFGERELPDLGLKALAKVRHSGWQQEVCWYFDAIEIADMHMELAQVSGGNI